METNQLKTKEDVALSRGWDCYTNAEDVNPYSDPDEREAWANGWRKASFSKAATGIRAALSKVHEQQKPSCALEPVALSQPAITQAERQNAAILPNGEAVTNVYEAYRAGLTEAAKICDRLTKPNANSHWECATLDCEIAILRVRDTVRVRDALANADSDDSQK